MEELLDRLTAEELSDWVAFDRTDPIGDQRLDVLIGGLAHTVATFSGNVRKGAKLGPADFTPRWGERPPSSDGEARLMQAIRNAERGRRG